MTLVFILVFLCILLASRPWLSRDTPSFQREAARMPCTISLYTVCHLVPFGIATPQNVHLVLPSGRHGRHNICWIRKTLLFQPKGYKRCIRPVDLHQRCVTHLLELLPRLTQAYCLAMVSRWRPILRHRFTWTPKPVVKKKHGKTMYISNCKHM